MLLLFIALPLFLRAQASTFVGCVSSASLPPTALLTTGSTQTTCDTSCTSYDYNFFIQDSSECYCSTEGPYYNNFTYAADGVGDCDSSDARAGKIATTFAFTQCYDYIAWTSTALTTTTETIDACFSSCAGYMYASFEPVGDTFDCWCTADIYAAGSSPDTCDMYEVYTYTHSSAAAASGQARRRAIQIRKDQERFNGANPYCPAGMEACYIGQGEGYECLSTGTELESCGGCTAGRLFDSGNNMGIDCTTLRGVSKDGVSCLLGHCVVFGCQRGFDLVNGTCTIVPDILSV